MHIFFKATGALLLFAVGAMIGFLRGERAVQHAKYLEDMLNFLRLVQANLCYRRDATEHILQEAQRGCALPFTLSHDETQPFPLRLQSALDSLFAQLGDALLPEEKECFSHALQQLGSAQAQEQTQALAYALVRLEEAEHIARKQAAVDRKLYRSLGVSGGAAAALMVL